MDFKKIFTFLIFLYLYIVIVSCGVCKPSDTVSKYLKAESKSDYDIAYELLSENDKKIKSLEEYKNEENAEFSITGQCAPLVSKLSSTSQIVDLKKWLFKKKAHLEDEALCP